MFIMTSEMHASAFTCHIILFSSSSSSNKVHPSAVQTCVTCTFADKEACDYMMNYDVQRRVFLSSCLEIKLCVHLFFNSVLNNLKLNIVINFKNIYISTKI